MMFLIELDVSGWFFSKSFRMLPLPSCCPFSWPLPPGYLFINLINQGRQFSYRFCKRPPSHYSLCPPSGLFPASRVLPEVFVNMSSQSSLLTPFNDYLSTFCVAYMTFIPIRSFLMVYIWILRVHVCLRMSGCLWGTTSPLYWNVNFTTSRTQ